MSKIGATKRVGVATLATIVVLARLSWDAREARADVAVEADLGPSVAWMRALPALRVASVSTPARDIERGKLLARGGLTMAGGTASFGLAVERRWVVPLLGLGVYGAVGTYDRTVAGLDGSIAYVHPWTAARVDLLLPGLGYRVTHRRYMASASVRPGVTLLVMHGSVGAAAETSGLDLHAFAFVVQAEIDLCRLDPSRRLCVQVAPRIYEFGFLNGGTLGFRFEWSGA